MADYFTVTFCLKADLSDDQTGFFANVFEEDALSYSCKKDKGAWDFLWTFDYEPTKEKIKNAFENIANELNLNDRLFQGFEIKKLEDKDWLAESYRALPPFQIGSFFIYGSHYQGNPPPHLKPLMIEAATAFGSGEHGTTAQCILAIEHIFDKGVKPKTILDMGCGSGILAAAAAKLWQDTPVYAADNDLECVVVSKRHMDANNITNVLCYQSEGYEKTSPVWDKAPYDFIIANILAGPLIEMAQEQSKALAPAGYLILSGTLKEQADGLFKTYEKHGLSLVEEFPQDEWMTLLLQKTA